MSPQQQIGAVWNDFGSLPRHGQSHVLQNSYIFSMGNIMIWQAAKFVPVDVKFELFLTKEYFQGLQK